MMDYILLMLLKRMLKCTATHGNICMGAMTGAFLTCVVIILPIPYESLKFILFHIVVNTVMIRVGLKIKTIRCFVKAYFLLYIGSFLIGGVMQAFRQYVRAGSLFFATSAGAYYLVSKIWDYLASIHKINQYDCMVDLYLDEKMHQVKGIIDTGNGLHDPYTNQPVSILDRTIARKMMGDRKISQVRYIPYHSIGKKEGVLLVVRISRMCIHADKEYWIENPIIGISEETISAGGEYQMILNPNLF